MESIYHKHTSSNSYWDSHWYDADWYLCESDEEYESQKAFYKKKAEGYQKSDNAKYYGAWRMTCSEEKNLHAEKYYYGHAWQGKTFDCIGICFSEHWERNDRNTYIIKPGSVTGLKECTDPGIGWMYGS